MPKKIIGIGLFLFNFSCFAFVQPEKTQLKELSQSRQWLNLVRYEKTLFNKNSALTTDHNRLYLLSPQGASSPERELIATLEAITRPASPDEINAENYVRPNEIKDKESMSTTPPVEHPRCRFPARTLFLKQSLHLNENQLTPITCKRFEEFKEKLNSDLVSIVFSSYYLGNPGSTFGHTFLKIRNKQFKGQSELLDTGVNFAANPTTQNPVLYALLGITGQFPGTFTAMPYSYKVREYNDYESRDLWTYDLNLSASEIEMLIAILWEQGITEYPYYFFTKNCSTHILLTLDAAAPRLDLSRHLPFYTIPSATIQALNTVPGLVSRTHFRPSIRTQFDRRIELMPDYLKKELIQTLRTHTVPSVLSKKEQIEILDAWSDHFEFTSIKKIFASDLEKLSEKQQILEQRALIHEPSKALDFEEMKKNDPMRAHPPGRVSIAYLHHNKNNLLIESRLSLHDLMDPQFGYPSQMQIDFFNTQIGIPLQNTATPYLEHFNLFKVTSLQSTDVFLSTWSYSVSVGSERHSISLDEKQKNYYNNELLTGIRAFFGKTFQLNSHSLGLMNLISLGAAGSFEYSPVLISSKLLLSMGPKIQWISRPNSYLNILFESEWGTRLFRFSSAYPVTRTEFRFTPNTQWAIGFNAVHEHDWKESIQLYAYF